MTHYLDRSSCKQCQQWKQNTGGAYDSLPGWVHASNVNNGNKAQEVHMTHFLDGSLCRQCQQWKQSTGGAHDSLAKWNFMQAMLAMEKKSISCLWLTCWTGVYGCNISNGNKAHKLPITHFLDRSSWMQYQQWKQSTQPAHDSLSGWEFMYVMSAM